MLDLANKYSINTKTTSQTFTINSLLQPYLSFYDLNKISIVWFRQPPPPYQIQQLGFNTNKKFYKCNSLDYQCSIICKIFNQNGKQLNRYDYGPIQSFMYNRLSANLELRVQVVLFNNIKKCIFSFTHTPTLINPQNNNKYQLTQQDIRSIHLKLEDVEEVKQQQKPNQIPSLNSKKKKAIVVQNLFQRLILLKLFHQIPNGMYCYSMQILQILFYDQTSCNMALYGINRFKFPKKQNSQISKSMYNQTNQQLIKSKWMKKSNQSLNKYKIGFQKELGETAQFGNNAINGNNGLLNGNNTRSKDLLGNQGKRQYILPSNFRKSPKQSINSGNQSMVSAKSSKATQSRTSLKPKINQQRVSNLQNDTKTSLEPEQIKSKISILKQPKVSILSTEMNSKGPRQQKSSFPQSPLANNLSNNLKSSQLLIKPNQFKLTLSLRRSQDQLKTPRVDEDQQQSKKLKKKLTTQIQIQKESPVQNQNKTTSSRQSSPMQESSDRYVNEFQNLLFQGQKQNTDEDEQLCLNDSFVKMQEQEAKEKQKNMSSITILNQNDQDEPTPTFPSLQIRNYSMIQQSATLKQTFSPSSPTKSQRNLISLRQKFNQILQQNYELKIKNQEMKKQIQKSKSQAIALQGKSQIKNYQQAIQKMKKQQQQLINQINALKTQANNQPAQNKYKNSSSPEKNRKNIYSNNNFPSFFNNKKQSNNMNNSQNLTQNYYQNNKAQQQVYEFKKILSEVSKESNESGHKYYPQIAYKPTGIISSPRQSKQITLSSQDKEDIFLPISSLCARKSQQEKVYFASNQTSGNTPTNLLSSGQMRFMNFHKDSQYQKFRNNQSYSYKINTSMTKQQQTNSSSNKPFKQSFFKY